MHLQYGLLIRGAVGYEVEADCYMRSAAVCVARAVIKLFLGTIEVQSSYFFRNYVRILFLT